MYIVGQAYDPGHDEEASCWTIEIHRVSDTNAVLHYGCIQIYESNMDLCLLKAKIICDVLNDKGFVGAETMVEKLNANQGLGPRI